MESRILMNMHDILKKTLEAGWRDAKDTKSSYISRLISHKKAINARTVESDFAEELRLDNKQRGWSL